MVTIYLQIALSCLEFIVHHEVELIDKPDFVGYNVDFIRQIHRKRLFHLIINVVKFSILPSSDLSSHKEVRFPGDIVETTLVLTETWVVFPCNRLKIKEYVVIFVCILPSLEVFTESLVGIQYHCGYFLAFVGYIEFFFHPFLESTVNILVNNWIWQCSTLSDSPLDKVHTPFKRVRCMMHVQIVLIFPSTSHFYPLNSLSST